MVDGRVIVSSTVYLGAATYLEGDMCIRFRSRLGGCNYPTLGRNSILRGACLEESVKEALMTIISARDSTRLAYNTMLIQEAFLTSAIPWGSLIMIPVRSSCTMLHIYQGLTLNPC